MADVVRWVDTQEEAEVLDLLDAAGVPEAVTPPGPPSARRSGSAARSTPRSRPCSSRSPIAPATVDGAGDRSGVDPAACSHGSNTLYLCAPAHDQRRLDALFVSVLRQVVEHVYDRVARTRRPLDPPLLVVLDEAANIAPLADLDALAATAAGHGVQLVTVWHDLAQITARYGPRATTVVNNHRAKLFLSGISDPATLDYASQLIGDEEVHAARRRPRAAGRRRAPPGHRRPGAWPRPTRCGGSLPGEGVLVYGDLPPARLALRPWFLKPVRGRVGIPS